MTREVEGLEVDFTSVDINNSYTTCHKSRNKSQIPDTAEENNLPPTQASKNTHGDDAAMPSNPHSLFRDTLELITHSDVCQNSSKM